MKKLLFLTIVSVLFVTLPISAEPKPVTSAVSTLEVQNSSLKGLILDKLTKETLAGAVISANGQKVYSDLDGNFAISGLCGNKCQLKISMISYQDQTIEIEANNNNRIEIKLQQR